MKEAFANLNLLFSKSFFSLISKGKKNLSLTRQVTQNPGQKDINYEILGKIKDSNGEEICSHTFTTDEFGSFDGSFVIPDNLSNGFFKISNVTGNIYVKVEEYKRPTFEITFNAPDKSFKLNEEVELNGSVKAYAGFGLDNVNYNYTIVRRAYLPYRFWWFANYDNNQKQIAFGEGTTDANGNFNIEFELIPDKKLKDSAFAVFDEKSKQFSTGEVSFYDRTFPNS